MSVKEDILGYSPLQESTLRSKNTPVVLIPGFLSGDYMLTGLGASVRKEGFNPIYSGIFLNLGFTSFQVTWLTQILFNATRDGQKAVLAGHSWGGVLARYLGGEHPNRVSGIITLGTPHIGDPRQAANDWVRPLANVWLYDDLGIVRRRKDISANIRRDSIYTPQDEVIDYRTCLDPEFNHHLVTGSHIGLPNNRQVQTKIKEILIT